MAGIWKSVRKYKPPEAKFVLVRCKYDRKYEYNIANFTRPYFNGYKKGWPKTTWVWKYKNDPSLVGIIADTQKDLPDCEWLDLEEIFEGKDKI